MDPILEQRLTPYVRSAYPVACGRGVGRACTPCYSLVRRYAACHPHHRQPRLTRQAAPRLLGRVACGVCPLITPPRYKGDERISHGIHHDGHALVPGAAPPSDDAEPDPPRPSNRP